MTSKRAIVVPSLSLRFQAGRAEKGDGGGGGSIIIIINSSSSSSSRTVQRRREESRMRKEKGTAEMKSMTMMILRRMRRGSG